jgi:FkbM family methyltransferase
MSYSQNQEDIELVKRYRLDQVPPQAYIELGALDGIRYSNTKLLEDAHGWTGILIEPNPVSFAKLQENRPNNLNFKALISNSAEPVAFEYFENQDLAAVSSAKKTRPAHVHNNYFTRTSDNEWLTQQIDGLKVITMQPTTLSDVCNASRFEEFGLLSLDVEGHEMEVLQSYDWIKPISIILVEDNDNKDIHPFLESKGYSFDIRISNNAVYIAKDKLFAYC